MAHGVMFHHFHDHLHPIIQGSLSADQFESCIEYLGSRHNLLRAGEWFDRALNGVLGPDDVCLTFDDTLKSQIDVALPILKRRNLTAFWFVYSSVLEGIPETLEIYRYFRNTAFADMEEFYRAFKLAMLDSPSRERYQAKINNYDSRCYLTDSPYYTDADRWFRYVRDEILGPAAYYDIMDRMLREANFQSDKIMSAIWMNDDDIVALDKDGHIVGLHSYTHPTAVAKLSIETQKIEYSKNAEHLRRVLRKPVLAAAHPNGSYTAETLDVLRKIGIRIGFRADMAKVANRSPLEFRREDQAAVGRHQNSRPNTNP